MTEKDIIDAYLRIRKIDNTIPDEVLNFMKESSLEKLNEIKTDETCFTCLFGSELSSECHLCMNGIVNNWTKK